MNSRQSLQGSLKRRLSAYSLAAGAAVAVGTATDLSAYYAHFDNGGAGWFDDRPHNGVEGNATYDMILIQLDGTVLVDDAQIDPALPAGPSIELMGEYFDGNYAWGDGKTRDSAFIRTTNAGIVGNYWSASPEALKVGYGEKIGPNSDFVSGEVGLYGYGWYSIVGQFAGRGNLGFYIENDQGGRHYGWADLQVNGSRNEITLYSYTYQTVPDLAVMVGGGIL